jgi:hypothetical protein
MMRLARDAEENFLTKETHKPLYKPAFHKVDFDCCNGMAEYTISD